MRLQDFSLGLLLWRRVRESFHAHLDSLSKADRAIRVGKALNQLQERLVWSCSIPNATVEVHPDSQATADIAVCLAMSAPLTAEEVALIGRTLAQVNGRFDVQIRLEIRKRDEDDVKQRAQSVKKS